MQFGLSSYKRGKGGLPELPVVNMYAEAAPTEAGGVILLSRPGLTDREQDLGAGPVQAVFQRDNVLGSAPFAVSDGTLYKSGTEVGDVDGNGPYFIAGYESFLFVAGGARLWGYDDTALAAIATPDSFEVLKVIVGASRAIVLRADSGKFYWSDPLETDIEALDFATAENAPDRTRDVLFIDDILLLFGAETVEFWPNTGDSELPFQPLEGRVIEKGIKATGCATAIGSTFAWVTNDNQVCLQDESTIISNEGLEDRIAASTECSLFRFFIGGTEFLALRLDDETQVWNSRSKTWSEFASNERANWLPQCYASGVFGCSDGRTAEWGSSYEDMGEELEARFRAGEPINGGGIPIANLTLRCQVGQTPYLSGEHAEPYVEMRTSRDAGRTWGAWRRVSLGTQGAFRTKVQWRNLGLASQPGFMAEFRKTSPIDWRVSGVEINQPFGGR